MRKDNKGFTIIELLAAVVVLGILMGIAVPTVMGVLNEQRNNMYVNDALRLVSNADNKMRSDNKIMVPPRNSGCVVLSLSYMDNNSFETGPYGGQYDKQGSFVVAFRNPKTADEEYSYYVVLLEKLKSGGYRGINLVNSNRLYNKGSRSGVVVNVGTSAMVYPANETPSSLLSKLSAINAGLPCASISGIYFS